MVESMKWFEGWTLVQWNVLPAHGVLECKVVLVRGFCVMGSNCRAL